MTLLGSYHFLRGGRSSVCGGDGQFLLMTQKGDKICLGVQEGWGGQNSRTPLSEWVYWNLQHR